METNALPDITTLPAVEHSCWAVFAAQVVPWLAVVALAVFLWIALHNAPKLSKLQETFFTLSPAFIDGSLYVLLALFGSVQLFFTSEEAYKYVNPVVLFWIKGLTGGLLAAVGALKMFRSSTYADHVQQQKANVTGVAQTTTVQPSISKGDTELLRKP